MLNLRNVVNKILEILIFFNEILRFLVMLGNVKESWCFLMVLKISV